MNISLRYIAATFLLALSSVICAATEPDSTITARKAKGNTLIIGNGPSMRAVLTFSGRSECRDAYIGIVNEYQRLFPHLKVYCMTIPMAVEFYLPSAYSHLTTPQKPILDEMYAGLKYGAIGVDAYSALKNRVDEEIYSRTDHHWAPLGAYYAAQALAKAAGVPFAPLSQYEARTVNDFVGSMVRFSGDRSLKRYPEKFIYHIPVDAIDSTLAIEFHYSKAAKKVTSESPLRKVNFFRHFPDGSAGAYCTFMGGDANNTRLYTKMKNSRKLLILKDSFGNALPGYLCFSFEEIHVIDCRYFTHNIKQYITAHGITDIVFANNISHAHAPATAEKYKEYLTQNN